MERREFTRWIRAWRPVSDGSSSAGRRLALPVQLLSLASAVFPHGRFGFRAAVVPAAEPLVERDQAVPL